MAGYSKRSLQNKLGVKSGQRAYFANTPPDYGKTLGPLPENVAVAKSLSTPCDFIQFFTTKKAELIEAFPRLKKGLATTGSLWISWPKGASNVATDLNENAVRAIGLENGLVDVKVCAVDDVWSGLKFVYRLKDR